MSSKTTLQISPGKFFRVNPMFFFSCLKNILRNFKLPSLSVLPWQQRNISTNQPFAHIGSQQCQYLTAKRRKSPTSEQILTFRGCDYDEQLVGVKIQPLSPFQLRFVSRSCSFSTHDLVLIHQDETVPRDLDQEGEKTKQKTIFTLAYELTENQHCFFLAYM